MNIIATIVLAVLMSGCSLMSMNQVDERCDRVALYARGLSAWKHIGASPTDAADFSSFPVILTFQQAYIKGVVYNREFDTPADAYTHFYNECVSLGFEFTMKEYERRFIEDFHNKR